MLSKMQKIWLWIFGGMFLVPELIFLTIPSSIINYFTGKDFLTLYSIFVSSGFFINNWSYASVVLIIELIGVAGLFVLSIKFNKKIFIILLSAIILWLLFTSFLGYLSNSINLVI